MPPDRPRPYKKYDYENENGEQAAGEEEEVLRPQPLELHLAAHAFIDRIFDHRLKEKRTQNRGGDDQEDTGSNQLAAVLDVSDRPN